MITKIFYRLANMAPSKASITLATVLAATGCAEKAEITAADESDINPTKTVTVLRFSHFMTANDLINKQVFEPWAQAIETD